VRYSQDAKVEPWNWKKPKTPPNKGRFFLAEGQRIR